MHIVYYVQQLFQEMGTNEDYSHAYYLQWAKEAQEKKAALTAVSAGLFLLAGAVAVVSLLLYYCNVKLIYIGGQNLNLLGIGLALLICIVPVSLLVPISWKSCCTSPMEPTTS